jgi:hypothetical protein
MSTNINLLLRTDKESLAQKKRIKLLKFSAIWSLVAIGLISLGLFILVQAVNVGSIEKERKDVLAKMSEYQNRQYKLFALNDRIENIDSLLKTKNDLSKIAKSLLMKIPGDLFIGGFEVNSGSVVIAGQSKSLSVIGEFINNLTDMVNKKEIIKSLTLRSLALDSGQNVYQVSIESDL